MDILIVVTFFWSNVLLMRKRGGNWTTELNKNKLGREVKKMRDRYREC